MPTNTAVSDRTTSDGLFAKLDPLQLLNVVEEELAAAPIIDVHTHLCMPSLGKLGLWGIDELITYHYLEVELFRSSSIQPDEYWRLSKQQKADAIWKALFVQHAPVSEATRGVVAVSSAFYLPVDGADLSDARAFFAAQEPRAPTSAAYSIWRASAKW